MKLMPIYFFVGLSLCSLIVNVSVFLSSQNNNVIGNSKVLQEMEERLLNSTVTLNKKNRMTINGMRNDIEGMRLSIINDLTIKNDVKKVELEMSNVNDQLQSFIESITKEKDINDISRATVVGMAANLGLSALKRFVGSLRKSGFKGNVILGVSPDIKPNQERYLYSRNVTIHKLKFMNCTYLGEDQASKTEWEEIKTCAHPYPNLKLRWSRYVLSRDWILACETCTGPILVTDVRDVFFQDDPFGPNSPEVNGLQVYEEAFPKMTTMNWVVQYYVKTCKGIEFEKPMLCSGTTIGTRDAIIDYLNIIYEEMLLWMVDENCLHPDAIPDDQAVHNWLFYTNKLPFATAFKYRTGIVNTVGVEGSETFNAHGDAHKPYEGANEKTWIGTHYNFTDEKGFFLNLDGTRSKVVHQYDRFGNQMSNWLYKQFENF